MVMMYVDELNTFNRQNIYLIIFHFLGLYLISVSLYIYKKDIKIVKT